MILKIYFFRYSSVQEESYHNDLFIPMSTHLSLFYMKKKGTFGVSLTFSAVKIASFNVIKRISYLIFWKNVILVILFEAVKLKIFASLRNGYKIRSSSCSSKKERNCGKTWVSYLTEAPPEPCLRSVLDTQGDREPFKAMDTSLKCTITRGALSLQDTYSDVLSF